MDSGKKNGLENNNKTTYDKNKDTEAVARQDMEAIVTDCNDILGFIQDDAVKTPKLAAAPM